MTVGRNASFENPTATSEDFGFGHFTLLSSVVIKVINFFFFLNFLAFSVNGALISLENFIYLIFKF